MTDGDPPNLIPPRDTLTSHKSLSFPTVFIWGFFFDIDEDFIILTLYICCKFAREDANMMIRAGNEVPSYNPHKKSWFFPLLKRSVALGRVGTDENRTSISIQLR